jgi:hypothetical protein
MGTRHLQANARNSIPGVENCTSCVRGNSYPQMDSQEHLTSLEELRRELADVVDWPTARYETGRVLMHT